MARQQPPRRLPLPVGATRAYSAVAHGTATTFAFALTGDAPDLTGSATWAPLCSGKVAVRITVRPTAQAGGNS